MAKIVLLLPSFSVKSIKSIGDDAYGQEHYNNSTGAFSDWHYNKNAKAYLIGMLLYTIVALVIGISSGVAGIIIRGQTGRIIIGTCWAIGVPMGLHGVIALCFLPKLRKGYKKFILCEELYDYTKSVGDTLKEYKRCLDNLRAKFTLPEVSNQSGYFAFATSLYSEFFELRELSVYEVKYAEFTKAMDFTYKGYEGYVARTLYDILKHYDEYELGRLHETDELKIDSIVNNYPELESLYNDLDKINKDYQAKITYLYEEDQSLFHNIDNLGKLKNVADENVFSGERKYADRGIFVKLYKDYDKAVEAVKVQTVKAYDEYNATIKGKMDQVLANLDAEPDENGDVKANLVFTARNEQLDSVNDLRYQKDELERKIKENIDRVDLVLSRLDERVNVLRKGDAVAEVDFFETLLNTCDIDEINVKVTRIFQMLKRLRQQAVDYNKIVEDAKGIIKEEVFSNEALNIDTVPKRVQNYIDENIDVHSFISDLNVQLQIDEIKKRLHNYPIYLYSVYIADDDIDQVMKSAVRGYKFDGTDKKKNNVLHICASNNAVKCFDYFYKRAEAKAICVNEDGETPLDIAYKKSPEIFEKLSKATILEEDYKVKYHDYQFKSSLAPEIMTGLLNAQADYWQYMAKNSPNQDMRAMCDSNADEALELVQEYEENGQYKFAKIVDLKSLEGKYQKILGLVKNRETTSLAERYVGILRKYESYYDKKIVDILEKDFIDAVEYLNPERIDIIYTELKNYIAVNNSSYVTSLYKTEYMQNDLMLSTNMFYIERAMIAVYSCQNILSLITRENSGDNTELINLVTNLKKNNVKILEQLYEETPNKYAYRLLAEEDREFAASHDENDIYYKLLGVTKQSTLAEIKKAYKRQVLAHHRDRGGDASKLALINDAYAKLLLDKED